MMMRIKLFYLYNINKKITANNNYSLVMNNKSFGCGVNRNHGGSSLSRSLNP